jgi:hypothetical protein
VQRQLMRGPCICAFTGELELLEEADHVRNELGYWTGEPVL